MALKIENPDLTADRTAAWVVKDEVVSVDFAVAAGTLASAVGLTRYAAGDALLSENDEFRAAREVARAHHERWDGTGYPDGLAGEDIPLAARIVAVCDVYDALISERPYKQAWPAGDAIAEIRRMAGTHLDPAIVDAFLHLYATNVLSDLDVEMSLQSHTHDEFDDERSRAA